MPRTRREENRRRGKNGALYRPSFIYFVVLLLMETILVLYTEENVGKQRLFYKKMERQMFSTLVYSPTGDSVVWVRQKQKYFLECVWRLGEEYLSFKMSD
ncbi:hypothetical protein NPIL_398481 [Nephila pilipes]|uniref:Uncharacterized protein n=1 Tax=Nephila pilipes TaxID=299642 RepID=A0A8X6MN33_NEPPI|nr:hypothetical protein NPIL_398481 [Nephila pilipes]